MDNQKRPNYKGKGNHSINELEAICEQFDLFCSQEQLVKQEDKNLLNLLITGIESQKKVCIAMLDVISLCREVSESEANGEIHPIFSDAINKAKK